MSFNVKNPLSAPMVRKSPPPPVDGARGLFPMEDGWYDIDDDGTVSKLGGGEQSDWDEDDETSGGFIKNKPTLSKVATSGDYNDLKNTPAFMYDVDDDGVLFITSDILPDGDGVNY